MNVLCKDSLWGFGFWDFIVIKYLSLSHCYGLIWCFSFIHIWSSSATKKNQWVVLCYFINPKEYMAEINFRSVQFRGEATAFSKKQLYLTIVWTIPYRRTNPICDFSRWTTCFRFFRIWYNFRLNWPVQFSFQNLDWYLLTNWNGRFQPFRVEWNGIYNYSYNYGVK